MKREAGVTLMELIVATFILSIGVLAAVSSFHYISTSIQHSKSRTLSNNLGQEQVEKLKNLSYYSLLVTTSTMADPHFPSITYDTGFYTTQSLIEGGMTFTRATRVDFANQSGSSITLLPFNSEDSGLKQITVYTIWQESGRWQYTEIHNLMANPATSPLNATLTGTVKVGGTNINGALVQAIDAPQYYGYTNASGVYRFTVSEGSYTLRASTRGYRANSPGYLSVASGGSNGYNFPMVARAIGSVTGYVYRTDHIVISQVVGSTASAGFCQEYVELYNPTTAYVQINQGGAIALIDLKIQRFGEALPTTVSLNYTVPNSSMAPHGYFLIANTPIVSAGGVTKIADAVYRNTNADYPNIIKTADISASCPTELGDGGADSVGIAWSGTGVWIDQVGWSQNPGAVHQPPLYEGSAISQVTGLQDEEQYVRYTAPGVETSGYGRAYDSGSNNTDFTVSPTIANPPHNRSDIENPQSGTPAAGALVNFDDPVSNAAVCDSAGRFTATSVATGTWTMGASSGTLYAQVSQVTVGASVSTGVPNGITSPSWTTLGNMTNTILSDTTNYALVSGIVTDASLNPLNHIEISDGNGRSTFSSSSGRYLLLASTGTPVQITANASNSNMNRSYVTANLAAQTLTPGTFYDELLWPTSPLETTDFVLSLAGTLVGYYKTTSNTSIPGRVGVAFDSSCGGTSMAQAVSDNTGHFYLTNLSTGTYCIEPSLDPAESVAPTNYPTVVLASTGTSMAYSTFTITNGLGEITGQAVIIASTRTISTGVLVVASTVSIGGASVPPTISGATGILCNPCYYAVSSDASGTYSLPVRSNATPYFVYAWYGTTRSGPYSVLVNTAGQIVSQDLSW